MIKSFTLLLATLHFCFADVFLNYPQSSHAGDDFQIPSISARFGGDIPSQGLVGRLVQAVPRDGCKPLNVSVEPGSAVSIVFIERKGCTFVEKVKHAQQAKFSGAIIYDTIERPLVEMSGHDSSITIPSVFVDMDGGIVLRQAPNNTIATLTPDEFPEWPRYFTSLAAAAACGVLLFAMFIVYRRQRNIRIDQSRRMPRNEVRRLPVRAAAAEDTSESCCICLESYEPGEDVTELPCKHYFHKKCIEPWLVERDCVCPICKRDPLAMINDRTPLIAREEESVN